MRFLLRPLCGALGHHTMTNPRYKRNAEGNDGKMYLWMLCGKYTNWRY